MRCQQQHGQRPHIAVVHIVLHGAGFFAIIVSQFNPVNYSCDYPVARSVLGKDLGACKKCAEISFHEILDPTLVHAPGIRSVGVPFGLSFFLTPGPPGAAELAVLDFSCLLAILKTSLREAFHSATVAGNTDKAGRTQLVLIICSAEKCAGFAQGTSAG